MPYPAGRINRGYSLRKIICASGSSFVRPRPQHASRGGFPAQGYCIYCVLRRIENVPCAPHYIYSTSPFPFQPKARPLTRLQAVLGSFFVALVRATVSEAVMATLSRRVHERIKIIVTAVLVVVSTKAWTGTESMPCSLPSVCRIPHEGPSRIERSPTQG